MALFGSVIPSDAQGGTTFRNRFINGDMRVWQRGTTFSSIGTSTFAADRWFSNYGGTAPTFSRSTDVPTGFQYSFSLAGSSTSYHGIGQRIESLNTAELSGQTVTLSFYAKLSSGTATNGLSISVSYANSVDDFSATTGVLETNITSTISGSWTRYSYTFTVTSTMATNGFHVVVFNPSATQTFTMLLTGMQLERGSIATPFEFRPITTELQLCQRYFQRHGTPSSGRGFQFYAGNSAAGDSNQAAIGLTWPVTMRIGPSFTLGTLADSNGNANSQSMAPQGTTTMWVWTYNNSGNFSGNGKSYYYDYFDVSAEL